MTEIKEIDPFDHPENVKGWVPLFVKREGRSEALSTARRMADDKERCGAFEYADIWRKAADLIEDGDY